MEPSSHISEDPYQVCRRYTPSRPLHRPGGSSLIREASPARLQDQLPSLYATDIHLPSDAAEIAALRREHARFLREQAASARDGYPVARASAPPASPGHLKDPAPPLPRVSAERNLRPAVLPAERPGRVDVSATAPAGELVRQLIVGTPVAKGTSPSVAVLFALSLLLLLYALNVGTIQTVALEEVLRWNTPLDEAYGGIVPMLARWMPVLVLLPMFSMLAAMLTTIARALGASRRQRRRTSGKPAVAPMDAFRQAAGMLGVDSPVASQAYLLLKRCISEDRLPQVGDALDGALGLTPAQVRVVHLGLLRSAKRDFDRNEKLPIVRTVADLLLAVESAPRELAPRKNLGPGRAL